MEPVAARHRINKKHLGHRRNAPGVEISCEGEGVRRPEASACCQGR